VHRRAARKGRQHFAVTLSAAIMLSLVVSLSATPMMRALILSQPQHEGSGRGHGDRADVSLASGRDGDRGRGR
jgi:multidrug efflux pump subunit AcrB